MRTIGTEGSKVSSCRQQRLGDHQRSECSVSIVYAPISLAINTDNDMSAFVGHLGARSTSDQEDAGSTPAGSTTFFRRDLIMKYFLRSFSSFR